MRRVGIDIALKTAHRAAIYDGSARRGRPFPVAQSRAGIDELVRRATEGNAGAVEFVMEPTGLAWLPLAAELSRRGYRVFAPKPQKTKALRKFLAQHTKTDSVDACAAALVLHIDPDLAELSVPTANETTLRLLLKQRMRLVADAAKEKSRVSAWLVLAHPHLGRALGRNLTSCLADAFLRQRLDPFDVRRRGRRALVRFVAQHAHGKVDEERIDALWAACSEACALFEDLRAGSALPFDYGAVQLLVDQALDHVEFLEKQVARFDDRIAQAYAAVEPDRFLERQVTGFGPLIAAAVTAFAGDVRRFGSVKRFAAFFGLVPRTHQTGVMGEKPGQRLTKGGHDILKKYMFLAAEAARRADPELAATYERAISRGKHHFSAVIIVAHKLIRRAYAVLRDRQNGVEGVTYRLKLPDGTEVSRAEARAFIAERFPTKAVREAKKRAPQTRQTGTESQCSGSSEDATKAVIAAVPAEVVAEVVAVRKGTRPRSMSERHARPKISNTELDRS